MHFQRHKAYRHGLSPLPAFHTVFLKFLPLIPQLAAPLQNTGIYNFQFEIDVLAGEGMAGYADVVSDLAAKEHAKVYFSAEDSRIVMEDVFLNGAEGVEIRIYAEI